jgi:hypothetical protein
MGGSEAAERLLGVGSEGTRNLVGAFTDWLRVGGTPPVDDIRECLDGVVRELESDELPLTTVESALDAGRYLMRRAVLVSLISLSLGKRLGLESTVLLDVGIAGVFCDIGLAAVNDRILGSKHGDLIDRVLWNTHPIEGARILMRSQASSVSAVIVSEHHWGLERATSSRHPFSSIVGMADDIVGRILGGYGQPGHRLDTALIGLARDGTHYIPDLVSHLFEMSGLFTEGSRVRLSNKKRATIERMNPRDPLRPRVILEEAKPGEPPCDLSQLMKGPKIAALVVE